ncbi:hypothetical protein [Nonomuraea sediminis]|uniref:hypothetical protein n=1 Tax=Nonomuraea sediminis TaxID=2835864 RepID=UPI001BDCF9C4|nr:hypothetical protein [Nonomuraea sediminis]
MTVEEYARAVREALADHPDRDGLLEDLDDHLAEIAMESGLPLEERLGPPIAYAAELAAAYGGRPEGRRGAWSRVRALAHHESFTAARGFIRQLRPGWWVLRGYALAMLLQVLTFRSGLVPANPGEFLMAAGGVAVSVWIGMRRPVRLLVPLVVALNVLGGFAVLAGAVQAQEWKDAEQRSSLEGEIVRQVSVGDEVYNIKPYAKDGSPLKDVYLYDQDGKPITVDPEDFGYQVDRSCGEPVLNRYPLPLVSTSQDEQAATAPQVCPSPTPSRTK